MLYVYCEITDQFEEEEILVLLSWLLVSSLTLINQRGLLYKRQFWAMLLKASLGLKIISMVVCCTISMIEFRSAHILHMMSTSGNITSGIIKNC